MFFDDDAIKSYCLWTLEDMARAETDDIIHIISQNDVLHLIIECLNSDISMLYIPALNTVGTIAITDNVEIIDRLIFCGVIEKI